MLSGCHVTGNLLAAADIPATTTGLLCIHVCLVVGFFPVWFGGQYSRYAIEESLSGWGVLLEVMVILIFQLSMKGW